MSRFFAEHRDRVTDAGYDTGAGFVKLPYDRGLPVDVLRSLVEARRQEYATTGAGW